MSASFAVIKTIETHTEGMPTRIVVDGAPEMSGATMRIVVHGRRTI